MDIKRIQISEETAVVNVPVWWLNEILDAVKTLAKKSEIEELGEAYEYMQVREVLEKFKITHRTLVKLMEEGKIEYVQVGMRKMIKIYKGKKNILLRK